MKNSATESLKENEIGIVILNYKNYHETIACVKSLLLQKGILMHIVIVDNGSDNDSYEELLDIFKCYDNIQILKSDKNLGYAKGNNIGIKYLLIQNIKNIFVANSDLLFEHPYSLKQLSEGYEKGVGLINPVICNPNGKIDQRVSYKKRFLYLRMLKKFLEWFTGKKISLKNSKTQNEEIEYIKEITGIQNDSYVVSGSGFMLTEEYFLKYSGLYQETFLYYEEWATIILLHKANLKTKIVETNPIIHIGGASTPKNVKEMTNERRKICMDSWKAIFLLAIGLKRG